MLEVFLLYRLWGLLGGLARARGKFALPYQILLVALWIAFETFGIFATGLFLVAYRLEYLWLLPYLMGLLCAVFGTLLAFLITLAVPGRPALPPLDNTPLPVTELALEDADSDAIRQDNTDDRTTRRRR